MFGLSGHFGINIQLRRRSNQWPFTITLCSLSLQSRQKTRCNDGASEQRGNTLFSAPTRRSVDAIDMVCVPIDVELDGLLDGITMMRIRVMCDLQTRNLVFC